MRPRFTLDGRESLERHLEETCNRVLAGVREIVPNGNLQALVLGGGYGRGEGGVLRSGLSDQPYNDLEFYVCLRGHPFFNERKYRDRFHALAEKLTPQAGVEVEFKLTSLNRLLHGRPTMFSYDLIHGHRTLWGNKDLLSRAYSNGSAVTLPLSEATRLLMNRCSGLLFAREHLERYPFTSECADFVFRNQAKAQLALGDVVLAAHGKYRPNCRDRGAQLAEFPGQAALPWLEDVKRHHQAGIEFKLHPKKETGARERFQPLQSELTALTLKVWLWLEGRRLDHPFSSARDYALSEINKCPETNASHNRLVNLKTFGPAALLGRRAARYPRERLFHALALLLWEPEAVRDPILLQRIQAELETRAQSFADLVAAYRTLWQRFN